MQFTAVPRQLDQLTTAVPPELVAALVHPQEKDVSTAAQRGEIVPRSFLAAILAGLIVAILNAAANATFAAEAQKGLGVFSFGSANAPIVVALLLAGLWSGARTSAFCLLAAHWLLAAIDRTSHASYAIASGGAALVLALIMHTLGRPLGPGGLGMEIFSGIVAGLFYRLFAGTKPKET
jgi:hypothetical protein